MSKAMTPEQRTAEAMCLALFHAQRYRRRADRRIIWQPAVPSRRRVALQWSLLTLHSSLVFLGVFPLWAVVPVICVYLTCLAGDIYGAKTGRTLALRPRAKWRKLSVGAPPKEGPYR